MRQASAYESIEQLDSMHEKMGRMAGSKSDKKKKNKKNYSDNVIQRVMRKMGMGKMMG